MRFKILLLLMSLAAPAYASDGVLEINQACATSASGCFPGDTAGFPITISQQGSYRLTSNLGVPLNTTAIQINANMVTLDLGGFLVSGPNTCTGYPTTSCTVQSGVPGIASDQFLVVVRNGSVAGMGGDGIHLNGPSSEVDGVRVLGCGGIGIDVGGAGRVSHSFSGANRFQGVVFTDGGSADDNESRGNGDIGIWMKGSHGGLVSQNRLHDNAGLGIYPVDGLGPEPILLTKNVMSGNANGTWILGSGATSLGDNMCALTRC